MDIKGIDVVLGINGYFAFLIRIPIRIYDLPFFGDVRQEVGKITNFHLENLD